MNFAQAANLEHTGSIRPQGPDQGSMGLLRINDALVIVMDIKASNGIIHIIDTVMIPEQRLIRSPDREGRGFDRALGGFLKILIRQRELSEQIGWQIDNEVYCRSWSIAPLQLNPNIAAEILSQTADSGKTHAAA